METPTNNPSPKIGNFEENKIFAALGYLGILCLIPLLAKREDAFCQFHGKQGLVLLITWMILWVGNIIPILGQLVFVVGSAVLLFLVVVGIIRALNGEEWELPVLGKYAKQIKL
ncbi:MAG: DUF4870 domain-containing protein [Candidatus Uhrbacteria bacterium]